jgi:hypothetical protein
MPSQPGKPAFLQIFHVGITTRIRNATRTPGEIVIVKSFIPVCLRELNGAVTANQSILSLIGRGVYRRSSVACCNCPLHANIRHPTNPPQVSNVVRIHPDRDRSGLSIHAARSRCQHRGGLAGSAGIGSGVVIGGGVIHSNRRSVILGVVVIGPSGRPLSLPGAAVGLRLAAMKRLSAVIGSWLRQAVPPLVFVRHQARPAE